MEKIRVEMWPTYCQNMWKPLCVCKSRLKSLTFSFFRWDYDVSARLWCHYMGIPCQNWGNPLKIAIFCRFHLVMCIPITKLNVTIPVLLKTSFKYRFHLPCFPLTPLPCPTPCPTPLALTLLPPFCNPFPWQFYPPWFSDFIIGWKCVEWVQEN